MDPVSVIATKTASNFAFTGTYTSWSTSAESTAIQNYIYYKNGATEILYPTSSTTANAATTRSPRITVLGQS